MFLKIINCVCAGICTWRPELLGPPGDSVTAIVRHHMWVLDTELRSSTRVVQTLDPAKKKILVKLKLKACTHIKQYIV